ncbi:subunit H of magnesium-chelatase [Chloropicon primus]|uniref:magnesium chelatase n=3 Tax=Chloropicon primus TaxID=1764295 RepID=A0A5B8MDK1_9CHLO|nr:subunit H of magnesium-chelatase [Chloropicon primus]UPQ97698.1 subunit H of magnesium-chelatase [Chloropicon primus]|eukprot:QDZ18489.1 subunit H of magnesium-chelatase [Chloropicon primus]
MEGVLSRKRNPVVMGAAGTTSTSAAWGAGGRRTGGLPRYLTRPSHPSHPSHRHRQRHHRPGALDKRTSRTEKFLEGLERESEESLEAQRREREEELQRKEGEIEEVRAEIDALYLEIFSSEELRQVSGAKGIRSAADFKSLGREDPESFKLVMDGLQQGKQWKELQERSHALKLREMGLREQLEQLRSEARDWARGATALAREEGDDDDELGGDFGARVGGELRQVNIVFVCGFEAFNISLYKKVAQSLRRMSSGLINLRVFSDRDIEENQDVVLQALEDSCDVFFGSLLFDYDAVEWLKDKVESVPVRFVFESDLNLMGMTQVGTFTMAMKDPGKKAGPPPAVKKILSLFGSGREEDRMVGYLSMLKFGPKLLKYLPGTKVRHLRNWLNVYSYWNQAGAENVTSMFVLIVNEYIQKMEIEMKQVTEMPNQGCVHPDTPEIFESPAKYLDWYESSGPLKGKGAPRVGVLLYRKHVLTDQQYIPQLIRYFEQDGLVPVPIFINGVEAHTVVRDLLTTRYEEDKSSLKSGHAEVDAIVSTIGFPLVGGPAGSVEASRQTEVSREILEVKNVPYVVAAPLLIQDIESWDRNGMTGLQSIVLYALPELDGAIDTVPIGGLVADDIFLVPERVKRLTSRLHKWISLRRKPKVESKVAVLLYGFPPGVGATGTAALLNVPSSLASLLQTLREEGYHVGDIPEDLDGEEVVKMIRDLDSPRAIAGGADAVNANGAETARSLGGRVAAAEVTPSQLRDWLSFPEAWGPTEWGPIPFLPENDVLFNRLESQWGKLGNPNHLSVSAEGNYVVSGLQFGNVWIGVQPLLGVEGDPMRLLFERDLTPHPQYAAFYSWLQNGFKADAVLHFGTHGTVEWLPGSPVGNTGLSWSDVLLGSLPNVYIYTANNPSESIIAKRRGYGTIVSHNVPPYGRSGLYKQLAILKDLVGDYREDPASNAVLKETIVDTIAAAGLFTDCPYTDERPKITPADLGEISDSDFLAYVDRLFTYLKVVENRLFSEGLHVIGRAPDQESMSKYLSAYFGSRLPDAVLAFICEDGSGSATADQIVERFGGTARGQRLCREDVETALEIRGLLLKNTEEMKSVVRALRGEYIPSVAGGDLLRDGPGVLPTGRNIHALDPYRMPSQAAFLRGTSAAKEIIAQHQEQNEGEYPETCAVALWGLDSIKTKGDAVAIVLHLVGARTERDSTGRVARFELIPLSELGRPRIDVIANMSGIFRDSFQNVVNLLDDLFTRAAEAEEPPEMNFIRKHAEEMRSKGIDRPASRLFSNPSGDYGSMVNERVGSSNWEDGSELGDTWVSRNAFSYGKGGEEGSSRPEVLDTLLQTTDRVVQEIDSVEYGLTDIQEYYANTGALRKAAETARSKYNALTSDPEKRKKGKVGCSIVECFGEETTPKELEDVLRLEYRSKLLNPKWADAMVKQGSGGAFEISTRMTALLGWGATSDFKEDWVYDQAVETYVDNEEIAQALRKSNPQAFANILKRALEAANRGIWNASEETLEKLQEMFNEMDAELEGVERR